LFSRRSGTGTKQTTQQKPGHGRVAEITEEAAAGGDKPSLYYGAPAEQCANKHNVGAVLGVFHIKHALTTAAIIMFYSSTPALSRC
jgi:hypothetical protein